MKALLRALLPVALIMALAALPARAQDDEDVPDQPQTPKQRAAVTESETSGQEITPGSAANRAEMRRRLANASQMELPGAVDPATYRLGPGDVLQVNVSGGISRSITIDVGPEGTVLLPSEGTLNVNGLTLAEARKNILGRLRPDFRGVSLDVSLIKLRAFTVYVTGQVSTPGTFEANGMTRVGDVVLRAEPLDNASLRRLQVVHRDGAVESADLELFLRTSDQTLNPWLRDGDVVRVDKAKTFIYSRGAMPLPGQFELGTRDSLRTLLALSGGLVPAADSSRALLVRWLDGTHSESLWVAVPDLLAGTFNPVLRNGDRLYIYFSPQFQVQNDVEMHGQVKRPGTFPIAVGRDRISDVVRAAGGFLPGADLSSIRVRRPTGANPADDPELQRMLRLPRNQLSDTEYALLDTKLAGLREEYRVDWNQLQSHPEYDILLVSGDVITVERLVNSIRVDGQVRRPGILAYAPGRTVEDYITTSGGFSRHAWRDKVRVTRAVTGQTFLARDVQRLDPGDLIWVPERRDVSLWDHAQSLLTAAAQIATVVLAFRAVNH